MIFHYKTISKINPIDVLAPKRYYAAPANRKLLTVRTLVKEISHASSINSADVAAVIHTFIEFIPKHLTDGKIVKLDNFGTFTLNLASKGEASASEVKVSSILKSKIIFRPAVEFTYRLSTVKFQKI